MGIIITFRLEEINVEIAHDIFWFLQGTQCFSCEIKVSLKLLWGIILPIHYPQNNVFTM